MKLELRFTSFPLENLPCDTVIAFAFQGAYENINGISKADTRIWNMLVRLKEKGIWSGAEGETLLVPSRDGVKAKKILLKGLGNAADFDRDVLAGGVMEVADAVDRMRVRDLAVRIPIVNGAVSECHTWLETACMKLMEPFLSRHRNESDFLLKVMVSLDDTFCDHLEKTVAGLKAYFHSKIDYVIVFDRQDFVES